MRKFGDVIRFQYAGGDVMAMVILASDSISKEFYKVTDEGTAISSEDIGHLMVLGLQRECSPTYAGQFHEPGLTATTRDSRHIEDVE